MNSKLASLLCCLIMLVSFSGCTKVTQLVKDAQPTKAELLAEINEEHRRYEGGSSAPTPYLRHYDDPADAQKSTDYLTDTYSEYDAAKELNPEEAEEDVNYLFDAFYYDFAFLWGDRIFEKCGIRRDEGGDGGKTLEIRGKRRLSARDGGANYQQS